MRAVDVAPVNTTTSTNTSLSAVPRVAMADDGDFVVVWSPPIAQGGSFFSYGVHGQRFDAAGTPQGAEFLISGGENTGSPWAASDPAG